MFLPSTFSLLASLDSPFIVDSSTLICPSTIIPSAGILSPDCNKTISPTTTSLEYISVILPFLFTLHLSF